MAVVGTTGHHILVSRLEGDMARMTRRTGADESIEVGPGKTALSPPSGSTYCFVQRYKG